MKPVVLISLLLAFTGCMTHPRHYPDSLLFASWMVLNAQEKAWHIEEAIARGHITDRYLDLIRAGRIIEGMTQWEVMAAWGRPSRIETIRNHGHTRYELVYGLGDPHARVSLENGVVTGWQTGLASP